MKPESINHCVSQFVNFPLSHRKHTQSLCYRQWPSQKSRWEVSRSQHTPCVTVCARSISAQLRKMQQLRLPSASKANLLVNLHLCAFVKRCLSFQKPHVFVYFICVTLPSSSNAVPQKTTMQFPEHLEWNKDCENSCHSFSVSDIESRTALCDTTCKSERNKEN